MNLAPDAELDASALFTTVLALGDAVYGERNCPYRGVAFRAPGAEGTYFEGELTGDDYRLFRAGKISQAELGRRLDIRRLETVDSVKLKLREAREGGDHGYAMTLAEQWLEKDPGNAVAPIVRANILLAKKDFKGASALYEEILIAEPRRMDVWFNLAFAKRELGQFTEAVAIYEQLVREFDEFTERVVARGDIYLHLADTYLAENRLDDAEKAVAEAGMPETEAVIIMRAVIARGRGKPAESLKLLERFLKAHPESGTALYDLVVTLIDLKDRDGARKEYERLRATDPALAEELKFIPLFSGKTPVAEPENGNPP